MMRPFGGLAAVAVAVLFVCCQADSHMEQDHNSAERIDIENELEDLLRFLTRNDNRYASKNLNGVGGSTLLGRNTAGLGGTGLLGRNLNGVGGSSLPGRNLNGVGGSTLLGRAVGGLGGSSLLGRDTDERYQYARFVDSLGGGNFVRNLDSIGGANLIRSLDSIGGNLMVKKNLDALGGPNLIKRTLDSIGGANLVRNLDSIGGGNFVRQLDSIGGNKAQNLDLMESRPLSRQVREPQPFDLLPRYIIRQYDYASNGGKRLPWAAAPAQFLDYNRDGLPKRNFDEIDRSSMNTFARKRNFDEIDQTNMPFPFANKRFIYVLRSGEDDNRPTLINNRKRNRPSENNMDEIDASLMPFGRR